MKVLPWKHFHYADTNSYPKMSISSNIMTATIYDVASRAGVSITTVSRALNAPHTVNSSTLERIQDAIDELGFVPKAEATARARRTHRQIGVLAPFFMHYPSFTQRMRGIASALRDTGFELVVYNVDTPDHARGFLHTLPVSRRLDGLIIISLLIDDRAAERFIQHRLPTVLVEGTHPHLVSIEIDNVAGGRIAAEYLVSRGHRRIGFVGGDRELPGYAIGTSDLRFQGLEAALNSFGLPVMLPGFEPKAATHEEARFQALDLMQQEERPTAIFAGNDTLALGVLKAAREMELNVPDDIAVMGFDDADFAEYIGLSTISQSLEESGRLAVEMLLSVLADPARSRRSVKLPLAGCPPRYGVTPVQNQVSIRVTGINIDEFASSIHLQPKGEVRMKRRLFGMLGLLLVAVLVLAACGGGGDATPEPAAPAAEATTEEAAPAAEAATEEAAPATEAAAEEAAPATRVC